MKNGRQLLIGGLDVGLHTSIALLDLDGQVVCLDTLVNSQNSQILDHMTDFGNVMVISTDRSKAPTQVRKIASSVSAKLILPGRNMTKKKKRMAILSFMGDDVPKMNDHEKSALASAIFAYRKFRPSLKKLKDRAKKENKMKEFGKLRKRLFIRMVKDIR